MNPFSRFRSRYSFVKGNFLLMTITWILMFFAVPIPNTYAGKFYKDVLGADDFILSVISFAGSIALAFVQFPGGYLADKHGRRWLVYTMTFGVALSSIFFVFAPSWPFIVIGIMIQNFCLLYQPALFAIMLDSVSPENRGAGFTFHAIVTVAYFAAAFLRVKLKETLPSTAASSRPALLEALREYPKSVRESMKVWSKVPRAVFHLFVSNAVASSLLAGCNTYFVVYALEVLGIAKFQWAIVMAFMSLSAAIPAMGAGLRMEKAGKKRFPVLGHPAACPAMTVFVSATFFIGYAFYILLGAFFFFGLGQVLTSRSYQSLLRALTPREYRGKVVGCSQFFIYLSQALTQLLIGFLYSYIWKPLPFIMLAACARSE